MEMMRALVVSLALSVACAPPPQRGVVALISASTEWKLLREGFRTTPEKTSPYGKYFEADVGGRRVTFFHGGWGKVAAAGSTQWVIDHFSPSLLVNLGTCGGFGEGIRVGDVLLVREAVVYDIVERMGDADEAIAAYTTPLDTTLWPAALRDRVRVERIVSGDRDLDPAQLAFLHTKYGAIAGDWESGSIAWVAAKNRTRLVILRGVSDIVQEGGDPTYGDTGAFERAARAVMAKLVDLLGAALATDEYRAYSLPK
jgi:adenosylhomocysteine nucleosidase